MHLISVENMTETPLEFDVLVAKLPQLAQRIWLGEITGAPALNALLAELDLPQIDYDGDRTRYGRQRVKFVMPEDVKAAERRLRAAISKLAGKAAGNSKYWDLGGYEFTVEIYEDQLTYRFASLYSLPEYRAAARGWLDGADSMEWLVKHRLIDPANAEQNERGFFEKPEWGMSWPLARLHEGKARVSGSLNPSSNPPGVRPKSAEAGGLAIVEYLSEALGEVTDPEGVARHLAQAIWSHGDRSVSMRGIMGARARSIEFTEK